MDRKIGAVIIVLSLSIALFAAAALGAIFMEQRADTDLTTDEAGDGQASGVESATLLTDTGEEVGALALDPSDDGYLVSDTDIGLAFAVTDDPLAANRIVIDPEDEVLFNTGDDTYSNLTSREISSEDNLSVSWNNFSGTSLSDSEVMIEGSFEIETLNDVYSESLANVAFGVAETLESDPSLDLFVDLTDQTWGTSTLSTTDPTYWDVAVEGDSREIVISPPVFDVASEFELGMVDFYFADSHVSASSIEPTEDLNLSLIFLSEYEPVMFTEELTTALSYEEGSEIFYYHTEFSPPPLPDEPVWEDLASVTYSWTALVNDGEPINTTTYPVPDGMLLSTVGDDDQQLLFLEPLIPSAPDDAMDLGGYVSFDSDADGINDATVTRVVPTAGRPATQEEVSKFSTPLAMADLASADAYDGAGSILPYVGLLLLGVGVAIFVFTRLEPAQVLRGRRQELFDHIQGHPGCSVADLRRASGMSSSSAAHHLDVMEKYAAVVSYRTSREKRYFVNRNGYRKLASGNYKLILSALHNPSSHQMVSILAERGEMNQKELSELLGVHASTIHWHGNRLQEAGLINLEPRGKEVFYELDDPELAGHALELVQA